MAQINNSYRHLENSFAGIVKNGAAAFCKAIGGFFLSIGRALTRRYTVVLVPHTEKKVYNLQVSILSVIFFFTAIAAVFGTFVYYRASGKTWHGNIAAADNRLLNAQASLDLVTDEANYLLREVRNFESALSSTLSTLGLDAKEGNRAELASSGDFASFYGLMESPVGTLKEAGDLRRLSNYLNSAADPIREIGNLLNSYGSLLTEVPSIWPIQGNVGVITLPFGINIHPVHGYNYIHRGIDIATYRQGDPILATADGQVVALAYETGGLGNNVTIRHKHGFYTRYAHMLSFRVRVGQSVQQGDLIGYVGNTGLSTGPHLHYEVHIGSNVVDPYKYLNVRSNVARAVR